VEKGIARVEGEVPEDFIAVKDFVNLPASIQGMLTAARMHLDKSDVEGAFETIQGVLEKEPNNSEARMLLAVTEDKLVKQLYAYPLLPDAVPRVLITEDGLTEQQLGPQEAFLLSRMNGEWDLKSILSICPFREVDSLRMIRAMLDRGIIRF